MRARAGQGHGRCCRTSIGGGSHKTGLQLHIAQLVLIEAGRGARADPCPSGIGQLEDQHIAV